MNIFKACDIRGVFPEEINPAIVLKIARAAGSLINEKRVVVGGDVRISTDQMKKAVIDGLLQTGCQVVDIGVVPTPIFHFSMRQLKIENGIMVTASHNPHNYNGLKLIINGLSVVPENMESIKQCIKKKQFDTGKGNLSKQDMIRLHKEFLLKRFGPNKQNVIVDSGNGCYANIAANILQNLNDEYVVLFDEPDGRFPNRNPNSAVSENLSQLMQAVKERKADIGAAFDGDGDRVSFVDETGNFVEHDRMIALLCRHFLQSNPGEKIVYDQKCADVVPFTIKQYGGIPIVEKSGHSFIKRRMKKENAIMGGEISGHYFYRELDGGDDGLFSALLVIELLSKASVSLSGLLKDIPFIFTTPDLRIKFEKIPFKEIEEKLVLRYAGNNISRIDGLKIYFDHGWALFRPSITESAITIRFDAGSHMDLCHIIEDVLDNFPQLREQIFIKYPRLLNEKEQ